MNSSKRSSSILIVFIFYFFCFGISLTFVEDKYIITSLLNITLAMVLIVYFLSLKSRTLYDALNPRVLIYLIYCSMYFIVPYIDMVTSNTFWFGKDYFNVAFYASIVAFLGLLSFEFSFSVRFFRAKKGNYSRKILNKKVKISKLQLQILILLTWLICALVFVYYLKSYFGISVTYILSVGILGTKNTMAVTRNSGFLSMAAYSMIPLALLFWKHSKSKRLRYFIFSLTIILQIVWGYRFLLVQTAITSFAFFYLEGKIRLKKKIVIKYFLIAMIPLLLMTMYRDALRSGDGIAVAGLDTTKIVDSMDDMILDNFRVYNNYYGVVQTVPSKFDYVLGKQIITGTMIMIIPRFLWQSKPDSRVGPDLATLFDSPMLKYTGQAYPNLGEFYFAGGVIGVIICMFMYGLISKWFYYKYRLGASNSYNNIMYACFLGLNLQFIIRGYTPSNFYLLVFTLLPVWLYGGINYK